MLDAFDYYGARAFQYVIGVEPGMRVIGTKASGLNGENPEIAFVTVLGAYGDALGDALYSLSLHFHRLNILDVPDH